MHQFNALSGVQYSWREPSELAPPEAAQAEATEPEEVEAAAPVGEVHHGIRRFGEVGLPVLGHVAAGGQVERVVAPAFGHPVNRRHRPSPLRPLGVAVRVAVELHPLGGEVSEEGDFSGLRIHPGDGELRPLHGYVDALHPADLLHPGQRVLRVQDHDEARAVAGVLLLPQLQQLEEVEAVTTYSNEGKE